MPRRIALIVGVSQYEPRTGLRNLSAPVNDAQRVYEVLHQYGGFDTLYPLPLGTEGVDASGVVPSGELVKRLRELLNPQAGDEVELAVIYFSGHGVSERGQVVYLSASNERLAVAVPWLADLAKSSAVKNVCLWLDCCHSGEVLKFADLGDKGFCVVAASHADGEALALDGRSLLTELLCKALTPDGDNGQEIRVLDFVQAIEAGRKNLPQQVLCRWGDTPFTLTQFHGETTVTSAYPPDYPPYKGLLTFTQVDREFFFGRDGMIQQLLDELSASRFVPLLGASGSGKSSLVLAGLLPKLPESDWQVLVMRPTAQPLQNLRDTLVRGFPDAQVGTLASGADLQREVLRLVTVGKRLLLVIDQFEEVFTECRDDAARAAFFACLLEALDGDNPLHLVLTLRADFLGHCTEQAYSGLGQRLQHHALLLVAPTAGELREAITRPLALVGMRCEQALEDELVDQTLHAKGSLPLLQYVLEKLWQSARQERSRELTLTMYQQLGGQHGGGLRGVLNEKADAFYQQLEPQQQRLMEWLMVELTQVGDGQDDTRRIVTLQELHNRQPQYTAALDALLAQLVTHERLLTQDHDDNGQATITVAHEALIRDWKRLRNWLENNREIKDWRMRVESDVKDWLRNGGGLLHDERLESARWLLARYTNSLLIGQNERKFIVASNEKQEQEHKQALQQRETLERALKEVKQQIRTALAGKLANQAELAIRSPSTGNGWISQGLLFAIQAFHLEPHLPSALSALKNAAYEVRHLYQTIYAAGQVIASSSDGRYFFAVKNRLYFHLFNVNGRGVDELWSQRSLHRVGTVVFSPDGKSIICGTLDSADGRYPGYLMLLDTVTGEGTNFTKYHYSHEGNISSAAFSLNGKYVVSGNGKTLILWDLVTQTPVGNPWHGHKGSVRSVAFSPDSKYVVSGSFDETLRLWNVESGEPIGEPWCGHKDGVESVAFSPDGRYVISGSWDKSLYLWDITNGQPISEPWCGHENVVRSVAFSPDSKYVVSGSSDTTLRLWDVETGQQIGKPWHGHEGVVLSVSFSQDGSHVISSSMDQTLRLWNIIICQSVGERENRGKNSRDFSVPDLDGKGVISGRWTDTDRRSSIDELGESHVIALNPKYPESLVIGSSKGFLSLGVKNNEQWIMHNWLAHRSGVRSVAISPDNKYVVSCGWDSTIRMWDVLTGLSIGEPWQEYEVKAVAFSSDGKYIVSNNKKNIIHLWDAVPESWAKKACSIVNRNFSLAEWQRFIGDALPYEKTCPDLPAPGEEGWEEPYAGE